MIIIDKIISNYLKRNLRIEIIEGNHYTNIKWYKRATIQLLLNNEEISKDFIKIEIIPTEYEIEVNNKKYGNED